MAEPWIGPRQERWTDYLPDSWQTAINTSPVVNALARYMNRPSFEEGVRQWQDSIPGNSPIDRIADRKSTLAQEFPQPMNPLGQSLMETGGFVANFIGPSGVRLPGRPQMTRVPETGGGNGAYTPYPEKPFVAPGATELVPGRYRVPYKDGELSYKMMDDGTANLSLYTMPEGRGRGEARRAVQSFIAAADAAKQPLSLEISPGSPGVSADRLRNFYSSLGFEGPDYYMTRQPAAPKPQGIRAYHGSPHDVVFDDKMIEILRKYGLLPPVAAGAAQALSQGQDTAY